MPNLSALNTGAAPVHFKLAQWSIKELISYITSRTLNLQPHYQRNAIWSAPAQRRLIATIKNGYPLPNIFVRATKGGKYEVVDGQQRCRAIFAYWDGELADEDKVVMRTPSATRGTPASAAWKSSFEGYTLQVAIIESAVSDTDIEKFYVLLNTSGVRLNSPELRKADFYDTRFLSIVRDLCDMDSFKELNLFGSKSVDRMNDVEFVSELLTYLVYGFTEKKDKVEELYKEDIGSAKAEELRKQFSTVINAIAELNAIVPIQHTRYKQKADFYSLFAFIARSLSIESDAKKYFYETLLRLDQFISPSREDCEPLMEYALNCVSQSHSKVARERRNQLFVSLFENYTAEPDAAQLSIATFFNASRSTVFVKRWGRTLLVNEALSKET